MAFRAKAWVKGALRARSRVYGLWWFGFVGCGIWDLALSMPHKRIRAAAWPKPSLLEYDLIVGCTA